MSLIIFICTANMCRSPMAEGILKHRLSELAREDILVSSMGTHGMEGNSATELAIDVCRQNNIDISNHKSRHLVAEELADSDLIFVMEPIHKEFLHVFFPQVSQQTFLLGCWPGKECRKGIIKDPVGGKFEIYQKAFQSLYYHINRIIPFILTKFPQAIPHTL